MLQRHSLYAFSSPFQQHCLYLFKPSTAAPHQGPWVPQWCAPRPQPGTFALSPIFLRSMFFQFPRWTGSAGRAALPSHPRQAELWALAVTLPFRDALGVEPLGPNTSQV